MQQHYTNWKCKDVQKSFAKARAKLVADAKSRNLEIVIDDADGYFKAEGFDCCNSRVTFYAGIPDDCRETHYVERQYYNGDYIEMFRPKAA